MGNKKNKNKTPPVVDDDDVIELHHTGNIEPGAQSEWLTNQVEADARSKKRKGQKENAYGVIDMCVIGLERIFGTTQDSEFLQLPLPTIESQITVANMYHKRAHEHIINSTTQVNAKGVLEFRNMMDRVDHLHENLISVLDNRKRTLESNSIGATHTQPVATGHTLAPEIKVRKVEIEKFDGNDAKWTQFKSSFEDCFHNRADLTGATKFYHLIAHLEPNSEAYNTISGMPRTDEMYDVAWKALVDAYENKRKIVNKIVLSFIDMASIDRPSRNALIALINNTNNLLNSLPTYGIQVQHWDPILVPLLLRKLDGESIRLWSLERDQKKIAEIKPLLEFIRKRADGMDTDFRLTVDDSVRQYTSHASTLGTGPTLLSKRHFRGADSTVNVQSDSTNASSSNYKHDPNAVKRRRGNCYHCSGPHQLFGCESFGRMTIELREERLRSLGVCTKCLRRGHTKDSCSITNCRCGEPHNRLLCPQQSKTASVMTMVDSATVTDIDGSLIATLSVIASDANGNSVKVRAMSDGGSHMCMVSSRLVQQLKLPQNKLSIPMSGPGKSSLSSKAIVDLKIAPSLNGWNEGEWIRAGVLSSVSHPLPVSEFDISTWNHIQGLPLADSKFNIPNDIDILLSVEFMARIQQEGLRKNRSDPKLPIAGKTTFGWVIYGALPETQRFGSISHLSLEESNILAHNLEMLWQVDVVKERSLLTPEEQLCKKIFDESIKKGEDGHYVVAMPLVPNHPKLGNSLRAAIARQLQNEKRFRKDPALKAKYVNDLRQFIDLDHMELVPPQEIDKSSSEIYYIPHHAARSNKFRVVFDGSVKTSSGVSLNDILLNGPRVQEDLTTIVMKFRTYRIALTTDITKMYRQVRVPKEQRDLLRIVWRENENEPLKHYRLKTQTYGLKSSSFCCIEALRHCAREYASEFPVASKAVLQSFYADDGTLGADSELEAEELYHQLNVMLERGGFPLAKWATNNEYMQSVIGATAKSVDLELFNENSVLGIKWSVQEDYFRYQLTENIEDRAPTKRYIVSSVAKLYDPNGWISPVVVLGKMLIQEIWESGCDWDTIVSGDLQSKWHEYRRTLSELSRITIPRWLGISRGIGVQLHGFSDASKLAYGVAFYIRVIGEDGIRCELVASKSRVRPLKGMTIPRMELSGALLMAKMIKEVCMAHDVQVERVTLWCDSSIVLHWLSKCPAGMNTFVGNRIAEIQELTKGIQWNHVRTNENPADLTSRGKIASELVDNSFWFNGPSWLSKDESEWPASAFVVDREVEEATSIETVRLQTMTISKIDIVPRIEVKMKDQPFELLLDRCGSMKKLVHVTARVLRFIDMAREKKRYRSICISQDEYLNAQSIWIKYHQRKFFSKEIESCKKPKEVSGSEDKKKKKRKDLNVSHDSPIAKLTPFVDGDGIMRVGGRIKRSMMPFDTVHPIILHHTCRFTHLVALEAHKTTLHGGNQLCMQYVRQRFWIVNVRKAIKRVTLKCVPCFRQRKETATQLMGSLPAARVTSGYAFESIGVDYCGPVTVKEKLGRGKKTYKSYIAVFVCMKTKAVHLDLVTDLTTDAFMACLTRLVSLRGSVREIFSDNATTFHGASNELKMIYEHWTNIAASECFQLKQVKWNFIAPLSPNQGGLWERAVRSAKNHLRRVVGTQVLTYEEFGTVLASVSACMNSRPLIALDDDPTACEALTPAHLVVGRRLIGPTQFDYTSIPDNRLARWRLIQKIAQEFWNSWRTEYVSQQIETSKWRKRNENIKVGAIVLVKHDSLPPTHWPLARVIATFNGDDGLVRNVEVKLGSSSFKRGINKIACLPIDDDDD